MKADRLHPLELWLITAVRKEFNEMFHALIEAGERIGPFAIRKRSHACMDAFICAHFIKLALEFLISQFVLFFQFLGSAIEVTAMKRSLFDQGLVQIS